MKKVLLIACVCFLGLGPKAFAGTADKPSLDWPNSPSKESARNVIRERKWPEKRNLTTYLLEFPLEFASDLFRLDAKSHLLDSGAGGAYFAEDMVALKNLKGIQSHLHSQTQKALKSYVNIPTKKRPKVTAVSLNPERNNVPTYGGQLRFLWGRFFTEIPDKELGKFDLITDLNGVVAFAPNVDEVLRKYLRILKDNGSIFLFLGYNKNNGFAFRSYVKSKKNKKPQKKQMTLSKWIQNIPGLKITMLEGNGSTEKLPTHYALKIQIKNRKKVRIPRLSLLGIDTQTPGPPTRIYFEK